MPSGFSSERIRVNTATKLSLQGILVQEIGKDSREQRCLIEALFKRSIAAGNNPYRVAAAALMTECFGGGTNRNTERSRIKRLNDRFKDFFLSVGDNVPHRVEIHKRTHELFFFRNERPPAASIDLVERLWNPYLTAGTPTTLVYPEPQFFRDVENDIYLRSPSINSKAAIAFLKAQNAANLASSFAFVPSGIVAAMTLLFECLPKRGAPISAKRVRPGDRVLDSSEDSPLIILATPTAHGTPDQRSIVLEVERDCPISHRGGRNETFVEGSPHGYRDESGDGPSSGNYVKWATVTRRKEGDRLVTLLAGWHGRAVEGLAMILTGQKERTNIGTWAHLSELTTNLQCGDEFPEEFQALFRVHLAKTEGEPRIIGVHLGKSKHLRRKSELKVRRGLSPSIR